MTESHQIEGQEVTLYLNPFGKTWDWSFHAATGLHGSNLDGRCASEGDARKEALSAARTAIRGSALVPD